MTLEEMRKRKNELGLTNEQLAERSGVPLGTVQKVLAGVTHRPRQETVIALESILRDDKTDKNVGILAEKEYPDRVKEATPQYRTSMQRRYTIADYYALPPERREELINGVFYDMGAPKAQHQFFVGKIFRTLDQFVENHGGGCLPLVSPIDVQLNPDGYTMVQPDLLVLGDRSKIDRKAGRIVGAPDLIVEVLSSSTARKDKSVKLASYTAAGVREYWLVDIRHRRVIVYWLDEETEPEREYVRVFSFQDKIPVGIWQDQCLVDMEEIAVKYDAIYNRYTDL